MAEQQPDPFLLALRSHGTHFFLFLLISADLLAALFGFVYGVFVGSWLLAFLYWVLTQLDALIHRDLLSTVVITTLIVTLVYGLIRRLWTGEWRSPRLHMLTISIPLVILWLLLGMLGVGFGQPTTLVQWIPKLAQLPFPNPFTKWFHLWPLWQWTGIFGAASYLYFTHRNPMPSREAVNIRTIPVRIEVPMPELEPEPGIDPFDLQRGVVDSTPKAKMPPEPQYREETRIFPLSIIHEHSAKWNILEECYKGYQAALLRFRIPPVRNLRIPQQSWSYASRGNIGWHQHTPVIPDTLFRPEFRDALRGYLAHEIAFKQGLDLWVRDLLDYFPNEIGPWWVPLLFGDAIVLPTLVKIIYMPGWNHDRTKDADMFAHAVGAGADLKYECQQKQARGDEMPSSATLDPENPTLAERIMQLEGLLNIEYKQMRTYGLVPPAEKPLAPPQQRLKKAARKSQAPT